MLNINTSLRYCHTGFKSMQLQYDSGCAQIVNSTQSSSEEHLCVCMACSSSEGIWQQQSQRSTCIRIFCQSMLCAVRFIKVKFLLRQPSTPQLVGKVKMPSLNPMCCSLPHLLQVNDADCTNGLTGLKRTTVPLIVTSFPMPHRPCY